MLSNPTAATPRPRPPAKTRRQASISFKAASSPPPPYGAAFPLPSHDSFGANSGMASPDAMNERSRDELSELLVKADGLIKERENDLSLTSAARKNLHDNNVALKSKHQALLARIPSTPSDSGAASPMPSVTPLSQTPHYYSVSLPRSTSDSYSSASSRLIANERRARKISVSHADIALLSDQNAELLQKLEKLESESAHADQAGRRVLKRLENEIQDLREELEKAQVKGEELEEQAKGLGAEKVAEEVWRKRKQREAQLKAMRYKYGANYANGEDEEPEVRDFAPGGALSGGAPLDLSFSPVTKRPVSQQPTSPDIAELSTEDDDESSEASPRRTPRKKTTGTRTPPQEESALISQLLLKIRELEEANVQIMQHQVETTSKLQAMQWETENMSKVYECLGDQPGVEWELVIDGEGEASKQMKKHPGDNTIRFKSLRRTLEGYPGGKDAFDSGSKQGDPVPLNIAATHKPRKSVVGLFDTPVAEPQDKSSKQKSSSLPVPFPTLAYEDEHRVSWSNSGIPSPALSSLSGLTTPLSQCPPDMPPFTSRTLESELGSEFGGEWGLSAGNHHLRTSSLYSMSHLSVPPSPSPMPASRILFPSAEGDEPAGEMGTPVNGALQLSVEPPQADDEDGASAFWRENQSARYRRMSQTVHSRTSRWVDGRFKDTLLGGVAEPTSEERESITRSANTIPGRLTGAVDVVVEKFTGRTASDRGSATGTPRAGSTTAVELHVDRSVGDSKKKRSAAMTFMLELWLWFQFGVIILVFLWAMAKRGPKSVLSEVDKRRVVTSP